MRKGDWMQTFTGRRFWPQDPQAADVDIEDIAHALSLVCRFGGHCRELYSVAQHSIIVSNMVPPGMALAGLLHDAAEAYVGDMVRPLKRGMSAEYHAAEKACARAIGERFGVVLDPLPEEVKRADLKLLAMEARDLMDVKPCDWDLPLYATDNMDSRPVIPMWASSAKWAFLEQFRVLSGGR